MKDRFIDITFTILMLICITLFAVGLILNESYLIIPIVISLTLMAVLIAFD
jgi:hypothetical protein